MMIVVDRSRPLLRDAISIAGLILHLPWHLPSVTLEIPPSSGERSMAKSGVLQFNELVSLAHICFLDKAPILIR